MQHVKFYVGYMKVMLEVLDYSTWILKTTSQIGRQKKCWKKWSQETLHHFKCTSLIRTLKLWTWACGQIIIWTSFQPNKTHGQQRYTMKNFNYKPQKPNNCITKKIKIEINGFITMYTITCRQVLSFWLFCLFSPYTIIVWLNCSNFDASDVHCLGCCVDAPLQCWYIWY